jgi:hypothetical protein
MFHLSLPSSSAEGQACGASVLPVETSFAGEVVEVPRYRVKTMTSEPFESVEPQKAISFLSGIPYNQ